MFSPCSAKRRASDKDLPVSQNIGIKNVTYASISDSVFISFATGISDSLLILGYLDWLKVKIRTLKLLYFLMILWVSSSVLKEFISTRGTSTSYFLLRCSICWTVKSRNVKSDLTGITDLGPLQPIEVPRPPFSFTTTNLFSIDLISSSDAGLGKVS